MTNNDIKNASLVRKSIKNVRTVLMSKSLKDLKIFDIISAAEISRSKFFSFFGSINTILELVISEELIKCYQLISQNVIAIDSKELITVELKQLRTIYFRNNPILFDYYSNVNKLPDRYNVLKEAVALKERELYATTLASKIINLGSYQRAEKSTKYE